MMALLVVAMEDHLTWPDAVAIVAGTALSGFFLWLMLR